MKAVHKMGTDMCTKTYKLSPRTQPARYTAANAAMLQRLRGRLARRAAGVRSVAYPAIHRRAAQTCGLRLRQMATEVSEFELP